MARRRRLRGKLTRNRSIALAIAVFAFAVVAIGGVDIVNDLITAGWYEGANFSVQVFNQIVPLQFASNFALDCTAWTESQMNFIDGSSRPLTSGNTRLTASNFNVPLAVIDLQTLKTVNNISGEVKMRCSSPSGATSINIINGELITQIDLTKVDDFKRGTLSGTENLGRINVMTGSQGTRIDAFTVTSDQIENAISTNAQEYQVSMLLLNQLDVTIEAVAGGVTSSARTIVLFNSWSNGIGVKIEGDGSGTPLPVDDNRVLFVNNPSPPIIDLDQFSDPCSGFGCVQVQSIVQLPSYQTFETSPTVEIFNTSPSTGREIGSPLYSAGPRSQNIVTAVDGRPLPPTSFASFMQVTGTGINNITPNIYTVTARSSDRSGTDFAYIQVIGDGQTPTIPIDPNPDPSNDPCAGLSGTTLQACEVTAGNLLSCNTGFTKTDRAVYDIVAGTPGVIIQIQPGTSVNEFTTQICLSDQSIEIFNALGQCSQTNFFFDQDKGTCICQFTLDPATPENQCVASEDTVLSADTVIFYDVVYNGANDFGSIEGGAGAVAFEVPENLSQLAISGITGDPEAVYSLARLHVAPTISLDSVPTEFGDPHSPVFTYKWGGSVIRADADQNQSVDLGIIEECKPPLERTITDPITGIPVQVFGPLTQCDIFDMNSVGVSTIGSNLGLTVESGDSNKRFYQIARSDIRPDQIANVLASKDIPLNNGDVFKLTLETSGTFRIGEGPLLRFAAITPMNWEHEFTWVDALGPGDPCKDLSGDALNQCLNPPGTDPGTPNNCQSGETQLACWQRNHPVETDPNNPNNTCRSVLVGNQIKKVCDGEPSAPKTTDPQITGSPTNNPSGTTSPATILDCPAGSTASQCADIVLKIAQERLSSILGLSGDTINTISNNAVLIVGAVIGILVFGLIIRSVLRRRQGRRF